MVQQLKTSQKNTSLTANRALLYSYGIHIAATQKNAFSEINGTTPQDTQTYDQLFSGPCKLFVILVQRPQNYERQRTDSVLHFVTPDVTLTEPMFANSNITI